MIKDMLKQMNKYYNNEFYLFRTLVASSEAESGAPDGSLTRHTRLEMSVRSISAVAILSSMGCSKDTEICLEDNALISNIVMLSKSEN
ncbi:unnamed protein product [Acanthoscelides obtectus]|uniref:Uncharacterized protein n=1 Tax=Acanthoscelides obtectus TaxID=200917 RepID=A0A9P0PAD9_ACAOB|nr:unnamed protein product [Acanthoscelides obtectus]CAK1664217.1 hypothetical protein AOBTE_LOCUS24133 [Acanthoscelides obtectus]